MTVLSSSDDDSDVDDRAYRIVEEAAVKRRERDARSQGSGSRSGHYSSSSSARPGAHQSSSSSRSKESSKSRSRASSKIGSSAVLPGARESSSSFDQRRQNKELRNSSRHGSHGNDRSTSHSRHSDNSRPHRSNDSANRGLTPPRAQTNNIEVHAQVVDESDGPESNNNLNIAMQQENERLRQQMEIPTATVQPVEVKESSPNADAIYCSKNTLFIVGMIAFGLIVVVVAAFFATRSATEDTPAVTPPPDSSPPTTTFIPSPTTAPTIGENLVFDPPSVDDCEAVRSLSSQAKVEGQDDLPVKTFEVKLEVFLSLDMVLRTVLDTLIVKTKEIIVPILVGCDDESGIRRRKLMTTQETRRNLNEYRYAVANAKVKGQLQLQDSDVCDGNTTDICYNVLLEMDLYLKSSDIVDLVFISLLGSAFGGGDLVSRLGLDTSAFHTINVAAIGLETDRLPTLAPTNRPVSNDINCGPSCTGEQSCADFEDDTTVACSACIGDYSCTGMVEGLVGDGSCLGEYSCSYLLEVSIPDSSCIAPYSCACLKLGTSLEREESCQYAGECCTADGSPLGIPSSSCTGAEETCQFASGPIGSGSCTGTYRTCWGSKAEIGNYSCNDGGCTGVFGEVADESCNGSDACPEARDVKIGKGSCNCDGCCSCLTEGHGGSNGAVFVPERSCNSLAPNQEAIDYNINTLDQEDGPVTYCCSE